MARSSSNRMPGTWRAIGWALQSPRSGGVSRSRLAWRALCAVLFHGRALRQWMGVVAELHSRGIVSDMRSEFLRAVRPYVHRGVGVSDRALQLIDHADW